MTNLDIAEVPINETCPIDVAVRKGVKFEVFLKIESRDKVNG